MTKCEQRLVINILNSLKILRGAVACREGDIRPPGRRRGHRFGRAEPEARCGEDLEPRARFGRGRFPPPIRRPATTQPEAQATAADPRGGWSKTTGRMLGPARPVCGMGQGRMTSRIDLGRIETLPAPPASRRKAAPRRNPRLAAGSRGLRAWSRTRLGMLRPDADRARRRMRRQGRMGRFFARVSTGAGNPADEPISEP